MKPYLPNPMVDHDCFSQADILGIAQDLLNSLGGLKLRGSLQSLKRNTSLLVVSICIVIYIIFYIIYILCIYIYTVYILI